MMRENEDGGAAVGESELFKDDTGQIRYNETCLSCRRACKQSFRAVLMRCPCYEQEKKSRPKQRNAERGCHS